MNTKTQSTVATRSRAPARIFLIIATFSSLIFTFFNIPLHADISIAAFFLSLLTTIGTVFFFARFAIAPIHLQLPLFKAAQKSLQYLPYLLLVAFILRRAGVNGTPYWFDLVTVILWVVALVARWCCLFELGKILSELQNVESKKRNKSSKKTLAEKTTAQGGNTAPAKSAVKRIVFCALEWVDALVQAVFMVLLIQIFIFQLYVIPSESMVSQFLIGDRVVVSKILCAPKFPLSDVGLPQLKTLDRGDIVVFRNPHYTINRKSEVKGVISQIVYMMTFTLINLNKDENGEIKYDPLVKRIAGIPGECLVMQDGVLYKKTRDEPNFKAVDYDNTIAAWNLNTKSAKIKEKIHDIPLTQGQYDALLEVEEARRNLSITDAKSLCMGLSEAMTLVARRASGDISGTKKSMSLNSIDIFESYKDNVTTILKSASALNWFKHFMCDWVSDKGLSADAHIAGVNLDDGKKDMIAADPYQDACYKLNLMIKMAVGSLYTRYATLLVEGRTDSDIMQDATYTDALRQARILDMYLRVQDQRNMCVFPPVDDAGNAAFIPDDCYFMMGDNRFNSLDMRHSYEQHLTKLTAFDKYSVEYYSNLSPQYVNKKYILGNAILRFWPLDRAGVIKNH